MPLGTTTPASALFLDRPDDPAGGLAIAESDQYLVENHIVEHLVAGILEAHGEPGGQGTAALDQIGDP